MIPMSEAMECFVVFYSLVFAVRTIRSKGPFVHFGSFRAENVTCKEQGITVAAGECQAQGSGSFPLWDGLHGLSLRGFWRCEEEYEGSRACLKCSGQVA